MKPDNELEPDGGKKRRRKFCWKEKEEKESIEEGRSEVNKDKTGGNKDRSGGKRNRDTEEWERKNK